MHVPNDFGEKLTWYEMGKTQFFFSMDINELDSIIMAKINFTLVAFKIGNTFL